jgi:hypothetical protein
MSEDVKVAITKLLLKAEPGLLEGDKAASARAAFVLCDVLGAVLASPVVIASNADEETFKAVMSEVVKRITSTALSTAKEQVRLWPLNTTRQ